MQKEVDRLRRLLRDPETVRELDSTSTSRASRGSTQLTWDAVFRCEMPITQLNGRRSGGRHA